MPLEDTSLLRLVIVEDDFVSYKSLKTILRIHFPNITVVGHCESVQEMRTLLAEEKPDIVLLDIQLHGGTAFDVLADIPERNFDFIITSAQNDIHFAQEAIRFGMSEYLVKPFLPEDIVAALKKVIRKRSEALSVIPNTDIVGSSTVIQHSTPNTDIIRAVIVDDERAQRLTLHHKIKEIFGTTIVLVGEAFSVDSAIDIVSKQKPDILFLDIELIGGSGFDVLDAFSNPNFAVIFVTSFSQYAARAFRYEAIDYILKPIDSEFLQKAIERVFAMRNLGVITNIQTQASSDLSEPTDASKEKYWIIKAKDRTIHMLEWNQIVRLKAAGKHTIAYLTTGKHITIGRTLQECLQELPPSLFYQTHRSHIINRSYFSHARDGFAFLSNGDRIDVSSRIWSQFISSMKF